MSNTILYIISIYVRLYYGDYFLICQGIPIEEFDCQIQSKSIQVIEFDYRSNRTQSNFYIFFPIDSIDLIEFFLRLASIDIRLASIDIWLASIDIRLTSIAIRCDFNCGNGTPWVKINFAKLSLSPRKHSRV